MAMDVMNSYTIPIYLFCEATKKSSLYYGPTIIRRWLVVHKATSNLSCDY